MSARTVINLLNFCNMMVLQFGTAKAYGSKENLELNSQAFVRNLHARLQSSGELGSGALRRGMSFVQWHSVERVAGLLQIMPSCGLDSKIYIYISFCITYRNHIMFGHTHTLFMIDARKLSYALDVNT